MHQRSTYYTKTSKVSGVTYLVRAGKVQGELDPKIKGKYKTLSFLVTYAPYVACPMCAGKLSVGQVDSHIPTTKPRGLLRIIQTQCCGYYVACLRPWGRGLPTMYFGYSYARGLPLAQALKKTHKDTLRLQRPKITLRAIADTLRGLVPEPTPPPPPPQRVRHATYYGVGLGRLAEQMANANAPLQQVIDTTEQRGLPIVQGTPITQAPETQLQPLRGRNAIDEILGPLDPQGAL